MKLKFYFVKDNDVYFDHVYEDSLEEGFENVARTWFGRESVEKLDYTDEMQSAFLDDYEGLISFIGCPNTFEDIKTLKVFKDKDITWGEYKGLN